MPKAFNCYHSALVICCLHICGEERWLRVTQRGTPPGQSRSEERFFQLAKTCILSGLKTLNATEGNDKVATTNDNLIAHQNQDNSKHGEEAQHEWYDDGIAGTVNIVMATEGLIRRDQALNLDEPARLPQVKLVILIGKGTVIRRFLVGIHHQFADETRLKLARLVAIRSNGKTSREAAIIEETFVYAQPLKWQRFIVCGSKEIFGPVLEP